MIGGVVIGHGACRVFDRMVWPIGDAQLCRITHTTVVIHIVTMYINHDILPIPILVHDNDQIENTIENA